MGESEGAMKELLPTYVCKRCKYFLDEDKQLCDLCMMDSLRILIHEADDFEDFGDAEHTVMFCIHCGRTDDEVKETGGY